MRTRTEVSRNSKARRSDSSTGPTPPFRVCRRNLLRSLAMLLGQDHKILCADATDLGALLALMDEDKAICVWTDPPYGNDYVGGTGLNIENDSAKDLDALLTGAFAAVDAVLADGAAIYVCH